MEKFHNFTDPKPLKHLFGEDKPILPRASPQLQCWALKLSAYQYKIAYETGKNKANADVEELHPKHQSMSGMKSLGLSFVW